ncbi:MAG TPA: endolytic transglycosylase MltG [Actinomycetota bacterium]|nr:endolytic transglycosylase MltG [Actinomycetota bacterium]
MSLTRRGRVVVLLAVLALIVALPAGAAAIYLRSIGVFGTSHPGRTVELVVPKGAGVETIGKLLEEHGVIESAFGFRIAAYLEGGAGDIQAGRYEIATGLTAKDALAELIENPPVAESVSVTFPEGLWLEDFARILEEETDLSGDRFLKVLSNGKVRSKLLPDGEDSHEGLLFPSTYEVGEDHDEVDVARLLVEQMEKQVAPLDFSVAESMGYSRYEALVIASMVEAEAKLDSERPKVARVIYNRLEIGEKLGIDATVNYAIGDHKLDLTVSELAIDSPYNTRLYPGLPPTPIGAPGAEALQAAAAPADGEWLFYVLADCDGRHAFSETYDEFLQDKAAYEALGCS